jgi:DNA-binding GntR family transcriptional regulator
LSAEEALDIAELRLALISLAIKPAYRHLSPADFDHAYELARRITRTNSAKEHFECNRSFWDTVFGKAERPILREVFRQLEDRTSRYVQLLMELFPTPESRPRQREALIEIYQKFLGPGKSAQDYLSDTLIRSAYETRMAFEIPDYPALNDFSLRI